MISYRKPYVESSVFIAFIRGGIMDGGHDCKKVFESILEAASRGKFLIYTSALTIAEVCKKKQFDELMNDEIVDLRPYFRDSFIRIIEVDRQIGEEANLLCQSRLNPRPETCLAGIIAFFIIGMLPLAPPWQQIARVICAVIALIVVIYMLVPLLGHPLLR